MVVPGDIYRIRFATLFNWILSTALKFMKDVNRKGKEPVLVSNLITYYS